MVKMKISPPGAFKVSLGYCILMLLIAVCGTGSAQQEATGEGTASAGSRYRVTVTAYCDKFARRYCALKALDYHEHSARVKKGSDVLMRIGNLFQPPNSRFTSEYDCRFRAGRQGDQAMEVSVGIFLTGTRQFAEYTKWEDLQIIPVEYVVDEVHDRSGYGVFKYLGGT